MTTATMPSTSPAHPWAVRAGTATAVIWTLAFAALNVWVQVDVVAIRPASADHILGVAILNGVAIALKLGGVALLVMAMRPPASRRDGALLAMLAAGTATLALWGLLALAFLLPQGLTSAQPLAGELLVIPGWTYPAFFLLGAVGFAAPTWRVAARSPAPGRWLLAGAVAGPPVLVAVVGGTALLLARGGMLPQ